VVFYVGDAPRTQEAHREGDTLYLSVANEYYNQYPRTRAMCLWALTQPGWDFVFKCDNDTFIAVDRLMDYPTAGKDYIGAEWQAGVGYGSGGAGYIMSRRAVEIIANSQPWSGPEDLIVGRTLSENGVKLFIEPLFIPFGSMDLRPKRDNSLITTHKVGEDVFLASHAETNCESGKQVWDANLNDEITFWKKWIQNDEFNLPEDVGRTKTNQPFKSEIEAAIASCPRDHVDILEIGCGPASEMGCRTNTGKAFSVTYCDPLAGEYEKMWAVKKLAMPHQIKAIEVEQLDKHFLPDSFDVAYACNCLDHSFDPLAGIKNIVSLLRAGGKFFLRSRIREGIKEKYVGLHQWNFYFENDFLMLSDRHGNAVNVTDAVSKSAKMVQHNADYENNWMHATFEKR
jgi:SAM-dependent methyltransferase